MVFEFEFKGIHRLCNAKGTTLEEFNGLAHKAHMTHNICNSHISSKISTWHLSQQIMANLCELNSRHGGYRERVRL